MNIQKIERDVREARTAYQQGRDRLVQLKQERDSAENKLVGLQMEQDEIEIAAFGNGGKVDTAILKRIAAMKDKFETLGRQVSVGERAVQELAAAAERAEGALSLHQHEIAAAEVLPAAAVVMTAIDELYRVAGVYVDALRKHPGYRPSMEQAYGEKHARWDKRDNASKILQAACHQARMDKARVEQEAQSTAAAGPLASLAGALGIFG